MSLKVKGTLFGAIAAMLSLTTACAWAGETAGAATLKTPAIWWVAPIGAALALVMAYVCYTLMKKAPEGDPEMIEIAAAVKQGANAYLNRQYKIVTIVFIILVLLFSFLAFGLGVQNKFVPIAFLTGGFFSGLAGFIGMRTATSASNRTACGARESLDRGLKVAFRSGAVMGLTVVGLGLVDISVWYLLLNYLYDNGIAFVTGYGSFDPSFLTDEFWVESKMVDITTTMITFGMGASTQALFARVGGGIYTKAADVGADLVGKVEAGIPEDDPRNPATIADNVGDNVGDVAGMGADLYESYCGAILATAALGAAAWKTMGIKGVIAPMVIAGIGNIISALAIFAVRTEEGATQKNLLAALARGVNIAAGGIFLASGAVCYYMIPRENGLWWRVFIAMCAGLLGGWIIGKATEYFTSDEYPPTKGIAEQSKFGPATVIIDGIAVGMQSTWIPVVTLGAAILIAFFVPGSAGEGLDVRMGLYGVSLAAVGMLATLGITLATDAYGPIADNAGGNAEMTHQKPEVRQRTDALDSLGNTTAATGKGFAIGSAALTALALLAAYIEEVKIYGAKYAPAAEVYTYKPVKTSPVVFFNKKTKDADQVYMVVEKARQAYTAEKFTALAAGLSGEAALGKATETLAATINALPKLEDGQDRGQCTPAIAKMLLEAEEITTFRQAEMAHYVKAYDISLLNPLVVVGIFIGSMMVFIFCSMTLKAVGRAAGAMVGEVRRQFKEHPGIMEGKEKPDYASCVAISTAGAQREMLVPSLMAIVIPIVGGMVLGVAGIMGLLMGGMATGFVVAVFMASAGGAWDNAKKFIERGNFGGKRSDPHKAAVVGDTVGDPFKDTSGPSLNILIKLMSMVAIVSAGVVVRYSPMIAEMIGLGG
ncbi:MAG TPA: sodium-translocating pyrophosphatase [Candidatus Brocadiia bacterium]|nr:sodium-translocating pyrophosphatase [Candidatus Brocadiia bacterium]